MAIVLVGLNHKSAPVEVREQLAFSDDVCASSLQALVDGELIREGLIVSTCNRVEILATTANGHSAEAAERVRAFLSEMRAIPQDVFKGHLYTHADDAAVRHVFRVSSSLDSMVVGEPQVLNQVRRAYTLAVSAGTAGRVLHRLMHHALHVAKRVRTETGIAASAVSISFTAVELGRKIFGSLKGVTVLVVGAGEMAELSAQHLSNAGAARILVANRTHSAGVELAQKFGGEAVDYERLTEHLSAADIVICSTGAGRYIITPEMAQKARGARRNQPAFFIDISVPRNVDPAVGNLDNLFVFDVDDLEAVIASNIRERERESERAELIVEDEVEQFQQALRNLDIGPTVGALRDKLHAMAQDEFRRQRARLGPLTPEQEEAVKALLASTVNKISHPVIHRMRRSYDTGEEENVRAWREIFKLDDAEAEEN
ncbi:MAG TPA: glutamyl-tRNA reductase [Pyrinomonadaceae bacterium]|jgi:glutamyl-tRNA reductase|nr:glutamyl-tRNA reductase [Pyrinomonadaceae bacterium]